MRIYSSVLYIQTALLILLFLIGCNTSKSTIQQKKENSSFVFKDIQDQFSENNSIKEYKNKEKNLVLYITETITNDSLNSNRIDIVVYDIYNENILYKNQFENSSIYWYSNSELQLIRNIGLTENPQTEKRKNYIIDVYSGKINETTYNTTIY